MGVYRCTETGRGEGGGGGITGNNVMCVALRRCVLLLGVWGYGPQEK